MEILYKGLAVGLEVTYYSEGQEPITYGEPEDCYEGSAPELEYEIKYVVIDCQETVADMLHFGSVINSDEFYHLALTEYEATIGF